jgi:acyl-CoA thioesterase FadM
MTGTLIVRYRKPTPLHTPLRFEAEYLRHEGRKLFTESRVYAGDLLCAEAEGIFVSIERERFMELEELRAAREAERNAGDSGKS